MRPRAIREIISRTRKSSLGWRYVFNLAPTLRYRPDRRRLSAEQGRILSDLNRNGIAVTTVGELGASADLFDELTEAVNDVEKRAAAEIDAARRQASAPGPAGLKTFVYEVLGKHPVLDPQSVFARFALQECVLNVANAYYGMLTRLRQYGVWRTFPTSAAPRESQLWHYDREDYYILKVFVYLDDVDEGAGPLTYAKGTHRKGRFGGREAPYTVENDVRRSTDEQMAGLVPSDQWLQATGRRGTLVFADTRGYHKGGLARRNDRLTYFCMFTSQASESAEWFLWPDDLKLPDDRERAFALTPPDSKRRQKLHV